MNDEELILGLFYADASNLVYDKIKFSETFSEERKNELKMLSFKFLGPVFLTAASGIGNNWKIESIEATLSLSETKGVKANIIQSFFTLNSAIDHSEGITNLFALISTPFTEDTKLIYNEISHYIHPSIMQGKIVNENLLGSRFNFSRFMESELFRGINLIEYSLGASRKMYWEEEQRYYCVGLIERQTSKDVRMSNLYTFDKDDPIRYQFLDFIPSYYVMSILPDYYEHLISETLGLFNKKGVHPSIRSIKLRCKDKKVVYLEETVSKNNIQTSFGVILVQRREIMDENKNLSYFKKKLRLILESNKDWKKYLTNINPHFKEERWGAISDEELNRIGDVLDSELEV